MERRGLGCCSAYLPENHRTSVRRRACPGYVGRRQVPVLPAAGFAVSGALPRVLTHIASRLTEKEHIAAFIRFASDGIEVEEALHGSFLKGDVPAPEEISPTCLLYTSVLQAQATAPVEVEAAAVLPASGSISRSGGRSSPGSREVGIPMHSGSRPTPIPPSPKRLCRLSESATHWPKNRAGNPAPDDRHLPALHQDGVAVLGQRLVSGKLENIKAFIQVNVPII